MTLTHPATPAADVTDPAAAYAARRGVDPAVGRSTTFVLLLAAVLAINTAVQLRAGFYNPSSVPFYAVSLLLCAMAGVQQRVRPLGRLVRGRHAALAVVVIVVHFGMLLAYKPLFYLPPDFRSDQILPFQIGVTLLCMFGIGGMLARPWLGVWQGAATVAAWGAVGVWTLAHTTPFIDVFPMTQDGCKALLRGVNPFAITFADIYQGTGLDPLYPPGFTDHHGTVLMGYCYPPLTLLMSVPGYVLAGDNRWGMWAAIAFSGLMLAYLGRRTHGLIAAAVLLTFPRGFSVLESDWTEPLALVFLVGTVWCAYRWRAGLPWVFGLLLCSKQYMFLFAPAALWLLPRPLTVRSVVAFYAKAFGLGLALTVPFVLWDPRAFWHSVIEIQLKYPPRMDAMSFWPYFKSHGWPTPPRLTSVLLVPLVYAVAWWRVPRGVWGFALTVACVAFAPMAFDQAFLNRNFFVMAAMTLAIGALPADDPPPAAPASAGVTTAALPIEAAPALV